MNKYTSKIIITLFASLSSLNAVEMISLHSVSETKGEEYSEMKYSHGDSEEVIYIHKTPIISTSDISTVTIGDTPLTVIVKLSEQGRKKLTEGTTGMTGKRIALTVNGVIRFAPVMTQTPLGGQFQIEGFKNQEDANGLVEAFNKKKG